MHTVYHQTHRLHAPATELHGGQQVPSFDRTERIDRILRRIREVGLGPAIPATECGMAAIRRIHDRGYLEFLETLWESWRGAGFTGEAVPNIWPARGMRQRVPDFIEGKLGYYALASETSIGEGTWAAVRGSAHTALTAQRLIADGAPAAFALCRPPGHHAAADLYGGYCFINNAAISAQAFLDQGAARVAILDVDFHHGNGTQAIFYRRNDVLFLSLHGDPRQAFPYFLGYADERGEGEGAGFNMNYPLPRNTRYDAWCAALEDACARIRRYGADALVISLGVDTFERDPISFFRLGSEHFTAYGATLAGLGLPTLFVMEGGYALEEIGVNTVNVLAGFEGGGGAGGA